MSILSQQSLRELGCVLALPLTTRYGSSPYYTPDITRYSDVKISGSLVAHTPHDATINGDCVMHVGKDGQGLMLFNKSTDYVTCPVSSDFAFTTQPLTIAYWVNLSTIASNHTPFSIYKDSSNLAFNNINATGNAIRFASYVGGSYAVDAVCSYTWTANTWYFIVYVRNGTSSQAIYVNMVPLTLTTNTNTGNFGFSDGIVQIGQGTTNYYFGGYLRGLYINKGKALDIVALRNLMEETRPDVI